jgi:hypothetical protein
MMRTLAFVGGGALVVSAVVGATTLGGRASPLPTTKDTVLVSSLTRSEIAKLPGPRQPIFFRHDIHAGQYEIPCRYCHYSVAVASEPGIPTIESCMGCHLVIGGTDSLAKAEITKVRKAWSDKQPIEWARVHTVPKHVHFPHMRHLKAMGPLACLTCHGDVKRMPQVYMVNNVNNMGFCVNCHMERSINRDCTSCHY